MLPLGVVIPTKNSMKYLPGHLANLSTWIDLAQEVVVVDSFSTDGTAAFLKEHLRHPHVRFVDHPPGLFASWNHGIRQLTAEFCYISTVGDSVTRAGLEHLVATAQRLRCDVLVSQPDFLNEAGHPCEGPEWPMDDVIRRLGLREPVCLPSAIMMVTAMVHTGGAITGSCASDLFRTATLQKYPFPLDFGTAGDGAWSLQNAGRVNWAATPEKVTTFRRHPPAASALEVKAGTASKNFALRAEKAVSGWLESPPDNVSTEVREEIKRLMILAIEYEEFRRRYNSLRKRQWPWILNPTAWLVRLKRNQLKFQVEGMAQKIYDQMCGPASPFQPQLPVRFLASVLIRLGWVNEQKHKDKGWDSYAEKIQFKLRKIRLCCFARRHAEQWERVADDLRASRVFNASCKKPESNPHRSSTGAVTFKHSGNAGDLIYGLPAVRALSGGRQAKLFLKLGAPINGWSEKEHPLGKAGLTAEMAGFLKPLLEHQTWLSSVQTHENEAVDYDLDSFRRVPSIKGGRGNIAHWYFWMFGVSADLSRPWLEVHPPSAPGKKIVLARSARYRNPNLDYAFLRDLGEIDFVGTQPEFQEMQQVLPQLRHVECPDALQLARVIQSARFFIGNQSFPYALAEGLKTPRILEVCPHCPDVMPTGVQAGAAYFQANFEKLVRQFWEQTAGTEL